MRLQRQRRNSFLIEPPTVATGDIAFNLIVFFLVCASSQPDSGRTQEVPRSEQSQQAPAKQVELLLGGDQAFLNGNLVQAGGIAPAVARALEGKANPAERIVVVKTTPEKNTPYAFWIAAVAAIEDARGVVVLQLEEERTVGR